ncbi:reverse transcriptase domain-containing protein [Tanacetum coccineum]
MDARSRSNTLRNEESYGGLANAHNTEARRGSDNVPYSFYREHKRSFILKKGGRTYPEGKEYTYALRFKFETTNNKAEYKALLTGLRIAQEMDNDAAKSKLVLLENFNENYSKCLRLLVEVTTASTKLLLLEEVTTSSGS